jgi:predicted DNA-binding protein
MTKLSPDVGTFSAQIGQFRVRKSVKKFLEDYSRETGTGQVDIIRLAIDNLIEAVEKAKKKEKAQS